MDNGYLLPELVVFPENRKNYINYTGNETNAPSESEYLNAKQDEIIAKAIQNMIHLKAPVVPNVPHTDSLALAVKNYGGIEAGIGAYLAQRILPHVLRTGIFGYNKEPETCIYTVTSQYGPKYAISGNKTFIKNPIHYGFIEIDENSAREGDLIQLLGPNGDNPHHMGMITGFDIDGNPLISQSHGGITPDQIEIDGSWNNVKELRKYYRFMGTAQDLDEWRHEYKRKFGSKK